MKRKWDNLLRQSVVLASLLVFTFSALFVLFVAGIAVVIAKILVYIK